MRKTLFVVGMLFSNISFADNYSYPNPPSQALTTEVDARMCFSIQYEIESAYSNNKSLFGKKSTNQNVYIKREAFGLTWYNNNQGQMIAFECVNRFYFYPDPKAMIGKIYTLDLEIIEKEIVYNNEVQRRLKEKQDNQLNDIKQKIGIN